MMYLNVSLYYAYGPINTNHVKPHLTVFRTKFTLVTLFMTYVFVTMQLNFIIRMDF